MAEEGDRRAAIDDEFRAGLSKLVTDKPVTAQQVTLGVSGPSSVPNSKQYKSLNDAGDLVAELKEGDTEVWYFAMNENNKQLYVNWMFQLDPNLLPTKKDL